MLNRNHNSIGRLLLLAALVSTTAAPLRAQQTSRQTQAASPQTQQPAPKFSGSIFGDSEAPKSKDTEKSKDAEKSKADANSDANAAKPAPSPIPYMTVA